MAVRVAWRDQVLLIIHSRPEARNAVDLEHEHEHERSLRPFLPSTGTMQPMWQCSGVRAAPSAPVQTWSAWQHVTIRQCGPRRIFL